MPGGVFSAGSGGGVNPFLFDDPVPLFASSNAALGASAIETLVAAAANLNGIWLINAVDYSQYLVAAGIVGFYIGTAAPVAIGDPTRITESMSWEISGNVYGRTFLQIPVYVPAGQGIFVANFVAAQSVGSRHIRYQVLV